MSFTHKYTFVQCDHVKFDAYSNSFYKHAHMDTKRIKLHFMP